MERLEDGDGVFDCVSGIFQGWSELGLNSGSRNWLHSVRELRNSSSSAVSVSVYIVGLLLLLAFMDLTSC